MLGTKFLSASIRTKTVMYLSFFLVFLIELLWLFQVVFFADFYKMIKTNNIKACMESIVQNISNPYLNTLAEEISFSNSTGVMIFEVSDGEFLPFYSSSNINDYTISTLDHDYLHYYYDKANQNNGDFIDIKTLSGGFKKNKSCVEQASEYHENRELYIQSFYDNSDNEFSGQTPPMDYDHTQSMIYTKVTTEKDGRQYMTLLNALTSPVNSTVSTLFVQLVLITVIFLFLGFILSIVASSLISRPIIKINKKAKELAKGNYDVTFSLKGYKEITELSQTLNIASGELKKVENLRKELIANVSHDLRTPLTMISGYAELIRDIPGENTPENIQVIIDETKRLNALVNDLMDISKIQSGVKKAEKTVYNFTQSIREILKRYSALVKQQGYIIKFENDGDVYVNADSIKMSQVIYNLINNAINFVGEDKTVIIRQISSFDNVRIEVEDHGEGIPQDKIQHIWERYYKVTKVHKQSVIGSGLGLSIVKSVLELHQAKYGVNSEQGKGSVFYFELPSVKKPDEDKDTGI